jgi:tetratricopeptide (TPR) repeat protein
MNLLKVLFFAFLMLLVDNCVDGQPNGRGVVQANINQSPFGGNTYALVIGISNYQNIKSLNDADRDAQAVEEFLTGPWGMNIPKQNVRLMLNENAKGGDIMENGIQWLEEQCKPGDRAILYFAGHGVSVGNNDAYLLAHDVSSNYNKANIMYSGGVQLFNVKRNFFAPMHAKGVQVVMIIDACRNFDAAKEKDGVNVISASTLEENTGEMRLLSTLNGMVSLEGKPTWMGHGAFTYLLLKGLYGEADVNKDGRILLSEIKYYLNINLPAETDLKQEPAFCCDQYQSFSIHELPNIQLISSFQQKISEKKHDNAKPLFAEARGIFRKQPVPLDLKALFDTFYIRLENNIFWGDDGADYYFSRIAALPELNEPLIREAMMNYCGVLGNDVQIAINNYMEGEMRNLASETESKDNHYRSWSSIFDEKSKSAQRLLELRQEYFPNHPYNRLIEMKYYFAKGRSLYKQGSLTALSFLNKALEIDSNQAFIYQTISLLFEGNKRLHYANKALEIYPGFKYALISKGHAYLDLRMFDEAQECFERVLLLDSLLPDAFNGLGNRYLDEQKFSDAEKCYLKALKCDSSYVQGYLNLGVIKAREKKYNDAEKWYLKAISIDSLYILAYANLGSIYQKQKDYSEAENWYLKAIAIDSFYADAYNQLGFIYQKQNDYYEAENWYLKAIAIDSFYANAYNNLGILSKEQSQFSEAEKWYRKAIEMDGTYIYAYNNLGNLFEEQSQFLEAEKCYRKAIEADSTSSYALNGIAIAFKRQSNIDSALFYYKRAISLDDECWWGTFRNIGILYEYDLSEPDSALKYYWLAILNPDAAGGDLYERISNVACNSQHELIKINEFMLSKFPGYSDYCDIFLSIGDTLKAINCLRNAFNIDTTAYNFFKWIDIDSQFQKISPGKFIANYLKSDSTSINYYVRLGDYYEAKFWSKGAIEYGYNSDIDIFLDSATANYFKAYELDTSNQIVETKIISIFQRNIHYNKLLYISDTASAIRILKKGMKYEYYYNDSYNSLLFIYASKNDVYNANILMWSYVNTVNTTNYANYYLLLADQFRYFYFLTNEKNNEDNRDSIIKFLRLSIELDSTAEGYDAWVKLCMPELEAEFTSKAIKYLEKKISNGEGNLNAARYSLARCYYLNKDFRKAKKLLKIIYNSEPINFQVMNDFPDFSMSFWRRFNLAVDSLGLL